MMKGALGCVYGCLYRCMIGEGVHVRPYVEGVRRRVWVRRCVGVCSTYLGVVLLVRPSLGPGLLPPGAEQYEYHSAERVHSGDHDEHIPP